MRQKSCSNAVEIMVVMSSTVAAEVIVTVVFVSSDTTDTSITMRDFPTQIICLVAHSSALNDG